MYLKGEVPMGYLLIMAAILIGLSTIGYFVPPYYRRLALVGGIVALPAWTVLNMVYQVPAGYSGLVYEFGGIVGQKGEGLQWVLPWKSVYAASVKVERHKFDKLDSFSQETQDVYVAATINTQVSPSDIQNLYRDVGSNYFEVLILPRVLQAFKDETVKYKSVEIAPNREKIRVTVRERLTRELSSHSITVQDLLLDNIAFSKKFQDAIEEKQAQTQIALAEKEKVAAETQRANQAIEKAKGEGQATLERANKEAEANTKLAASITPELVNYIWAQKLAPNVNVMMVQPGQNFIMSPEFLGKGKQATR